MTLTCWLILSQEWKITSLFYGLTFALNQFAMEICICVLLTAPMTNTIKSSFNHMQRSIAYVIFGGGLVFLTQNVQTKLKEANRRLEQEKDSMKNVLLSLANGVLIVDVEGIVNENDPARIEELRLAEKLDRETHTPYVVKFSNKALSRLLSLPINAGDVGLTQLINTPFIKLISVSNDNNLTTSFLKERTMQRRESAQNRLQANEENRDMDESTRQVSIDSKSLILPQFNVIHNIRTERLLTLAEVIS